MTTSANAEMNTNKASMIELKNITVMRGEKVVLDRLSLSVAQGENVAILGANGSGKSTLIKLITRELYPLADDSACFRMFGEEHWNVMALRARLGIVSNDLQSICTGSLTGRDVVVSGFFSSIGLFLNHHVTQAMEQRAEEVMTLLEIAHLARTPMNEMSSGEARRFLIARALVHDPEALILDEPATSLDLHALHTFRQSLCTVAVAGKSVVLVTHAVNEIIPEISRVILLRHGRIFADGPKEEILTSQTISSFFTLPLHVHHHNNYYSVTDAC
jgi:iron complex transport system ATP-binding protein